MAKRLFDILVSLACLAVALPVFPIVALLVKLNSPGPVFYSSQRMGLHGLGFRLLKFRTMVTYGSVHRPITMKGDSRITRVGNWLRRTKFDEMPTLLNVLKGDMSIVGPRPEISRYAGYYTESQKRVLTVRPGITDPGTLRFNDEAKLLEDPDNFEELYLQTILPEKLRLNLEYIDNRSFFSDLRIIFATLMIMLPQRKG